MSVHFNRLNDLRPAGASFGEVVGIQLIHSHGFGTETVLSFTKRKSIHVLPGSNAYWNWMALRSDVTRILKDDRYVTSGNVERIRSSLAETVYRIHGYALRAAYGKLSASDLAVFSSLDHERLLQGGVQYFELVFCDNRFYGTDASRDGFLARVGYFQRDIDRSSVD